MQRFDCRTLVSFFIRRFSISFLTHTTMFILLARLVTHMIPQGTSSSIFLSSILLVSYGVSTSYINNLTLISTFQFCAPAAGNNYFLTCFLHYLHCYRNHILFSMHYCESTISRLVFLHDVFSSSILPLSTIFFPIDLSMIFICFFQIKS